MSSVPAVEWFSDPMNFWMEYGVICLAGKWAAVKRKDFSDGSFEVLTDWLPDRKTAIGFLKLLKEK
jgi:hypothetical protein